MVVRVSCAEVDVRFTGCYVGNRVCVDHGGENRYWFARHVESLVCLVSFTGLYKLSVKSLDESEVDFNPCYSKHIQDSVLRCVHGGRPCGVGESWYGYTRESKCKVRRGISIVESSSEMGE